MTAFLFFCRRNYFYFFVGEIMRPLLSEGNWLEINSEDEYTKYLKNGYSDHWARVQCGNYTGNGRYLMLEYYQPCPKGCCEDFVREIIPEDDVKTEVRSLIADLETLLWIKNPQSYL
jgi:hypothetical protein